MARVLRDGNRHGRKITCDGTLGSMTVEQWAQLCPVFATLNDAGEWVLPRWLEDLQTSITLQHTYFKEQANG